MIFIWYISMYVYIFILWFMWGYFDLIDLNDVGFCFVLNICDVKKGIVWS